MAMEDSAGAVKPVDIDAQPRDDVALLQAAMEELRASTEQNWERLDKGMVELRSMYLDTKTRVKGLMQIMHFSDEETDSNSNDTDHHVLISGGGPKKIRSFRRLESGGSSDSGDGLGETVEHVHHDVSEIGVEVERLLSKVFPLQNVVKALNTEICELDVKYVTAKEEIERLKASSHDDMDLRSKMMMIEKLKALEARMKEIEERKTNNFIISWFPKFNISASFQGLSDFLSDIWEDLYQTYYQSVQIFHLKIDRQCDRLSKAGDFLLLKLNEQFYKFLGGVDGLIHKLNLHKPFVQGILLGSAMGLLLTFLYIKYEGSITRNRISLLGTNICQETYRISSRIDKLENKVESKLCEAVEEIKSSVSLSKTAQASLARVESLPKVEGMIGVVERKVSSITEQLQELSGKVESNSNGNRMLGAIEKRISSIAEQMKEVTDKVEGKCNVKEGMMGGAQKRVSSIAEQAKEVTGKANKEGIMGVIGKKMSAMAEKVKKQPQAVEGMAKPKEEGMIKKWISSSAGRVDESMANLKSKTNEEVNKKWAARTVQLQASMADLKSKPEKFMSDLKSKTNEKVKMRWESIAAPLRARRDILKSNSEQFRTAVAEAEAKRNERIETKTERKYDKAYDGLKIVAVLGVAYFLFFG